MILGSAAKQKASSALERLEEKVEQHAGAGMLVLLCLLFVALLGLAASDYLWYDELVIVRVAALPHWHDIWNFYASGLDTIGLLYAVVLHALRGLPADEEIRSRLPAIVSFLGMLWCTFVFVRRRYAAVYAFAVVLLLTTFPLLSFAVFAKSYAVELAGLGFAMICWQKGLEESRGWCAAGVWCGLAVAISSHTFAIFLVVQQVNRFAKKPAPAAAPTTKDCPQCTMAIPIAAKRCPQCTSQLAQGSAAPGL